MLSEPGDVDRELARHFLAATKAIDTMKALRYSELAGSEALAQLAPADALGWFAQALDLYLQVPVDETVHCDLLIGLGTAQRQTGDPSHRETLLRAAALAERLGDPGRLVRAALANNRGTISAVGQVDAERVGVLERALDAVGASDSRDRALLLATLCTELTFSGERERIAYLASEAISMARRLDDPATFLRVTTVVYSVVALPDNLGDRLSDLGQAVTISAALGDPVGGAQAHHCRALACLQAGIRAEFDAHVDTCATVAERLDQPYERWRATFLRAMRFLLSGDIVEAEACAEAALAIGADSVPEALALYGAQLMDIRGMQGRLDELVDLVAQAAADNPGLPVLRANLAWIYCQLDRHTDALALIKDHLADGFARFPYDIVWLSTMTILSDVCTRLEQRDGAALLYERLLRWQQQGPAGSIANIQGPVAFYLATLARTLGAYDDADGHFTKALDICRDLEAPYWIARTQYEWASMLCRRGQPGDDHRAQAMLTESLDIARQYEFVGLEQRAEPLRSSAVS